MDGSGERYDIVAERSPEGIRLTLAFEFCGVVIHLLDHLDSLLMDAVPSVGTSITVTLPGGARLRFVAELARVP